jgi:hypothetical protein
VSGLAGRLEGRARNRRQGRPSSRRRLIAAQHGARAADGPQRAPGRAWGSAGRPRACLPLTHRIPTCARAAALPPPSRVSRDDFFGREAYSDLVGEFAKWQNDKGQMPLTCHIYSCG